MQCKLVKNCKALCLFIVFLIVSSASGNKAGRVAREADNDDGDALDWHKTVCADFKGAYSRRANLGIVCCGNETLYQPIELVESWESNPKLEECTFAFTGEKDSDLPMAFWKVWLCVLTNSTAFKGGKLTFDTYLNYVIGLYPEVIQKKIVTATASCKKDGNGLKDNVAKLQKFTECLHKSEHKVCHKPYLKSEFSEKPKTSKQNDCPGMEGIYGIDRIDYCCKQQSIPFNFLQFYYHFPMETEEREKADNCSESFSVRHMTLDPKLKAALSIDISQNEDDTADEAYNNATAALEHCTIGCQIRQKVYTDGKDLSLDYEKASNFLIGNFGAKVQKDLKQIISDRKTKFEYFSEHTGDKRFTFDELVKEFKGADEKMKILYYCGFAASLIDEVVRSLDEYCLGKEHADEWYASNHNDHNH